MDCMPDDENSRGLGDAFDHVDSRYGAALRGVSLRKCPFAADNWKGCAKAAAKKKVGKSWSVKPASGKSPEEKWEEDWEKRGL
jgi:hypothetical protein